MEEILTDFDKNKKYDFNPFMSYRLENQFKSKI